MTSSRMFRRLSATLFTVLLVPFCAQAEQIAVSDAAGLGAALARAQAGDRIVLADGGYGELKTRIRAPGAVTIAAATPLGARFDRIELTGAANLVFEGVEAGEEFRATGSRDIAVAASRTKQFYFRDVVGLRVENSEGANGWYILLLNSVRDFVIRGNRLHGGHEDVMRVTGPSSNGLIENNQIYETRAKRPIHPDLIQFFHQKGEAPHDIVIRGNLLWDDPATGEVPPQGIFLGDPGPGFRNILIEENLIAVGHTNTIYINGGQENVVVRNNSIMSIKGATMPDAIIRIAAKSRLDNSGTLVEGNIVRAIHDETKASQLRNNLVFGKAERQAILFAGPGLGRRWQDFMPVAGGPVDFGTLYGAQKLLKAQQAAQN